MSNNKQQTAVEWLIDQLRNNENIRWRGTNIIELGEQAKEMEKERMIIFALLCMFGTVDVDIDVVKEFVKKYNETYGGNK
jgi:hypothetical protein